MIRPAHTALGGILALLILTPGTRPAGAQPREAELAVRALRPAPGLTVSLAAAEPGLVNPVAFWIDDRGRFYVVETHRMGTSVLDNRGLPDWLDEDVACRTVEDRIAMHRRRQGAEAAKLELESERVRFLEDRDGDGFAEHAVTFADGFRTLADGVAAGILVRGRDAWFANIPHLWHLRDEDGDGVADSRKSLHYGYGVRIAFVGHDLHGLRFGPDGKLYFSIGDRGLHVELPGGAAVDCTDSGAVLRCNPDGSELELYHVGLRNPQELAFDAYGNLWTGDNNSDGGDDARIVYVVEGGDSGWRVGYQYLADRGPWMTERVCEAAAEVPHRLPAVSHLPPLHGPSGIAYYPGTGLPESYDGHFLIADFPGGVQAFSVRPKGASFEIANRQDFLYDLWPTDVDFGPDGAVYVLDWVEGWKKPGKGRIFRVADASRAQDPAVLETKRLLQEGMEGRTPEDLAKLLGHRDMRVRQAAQFALADRGAAAVPVFEKVLRPGAPRFARLHAVWGLGQTMRKAPEAAAVVRRYLRDGDEEVRAQAARALGDARDAESFDELLVRLRDPHPRVRFHAALGVGKLGRAGAAAELAALLRDNADADAYLRHAAAAALAWIGDAPAILRAGQDESRSVRLGAILALRRLRREELRLFLEDADPALSLEAARAIYDEPVEGALPALADLLPSSPARPEVFRRALYASVRLGRAGAVAAVAAAAGIPERARVEALSILGAWARPIGRDPVVGLWRPLAARDAADARAVLQAPLEGLLRGPSDAVRTAAARASASLGHTPAGPVLAELCRDRRIAPHVRAELLRALAELKDPALGYVVVDALEDRDEAMRREGVRFLPRTNIVNAAGRLEVLAGDSRGSTALRQQALAALGELPGEAADAVLVRLMDRLLDKAVPDGLRLDLLEAAGRRDAPAVKERLARWEDARPKDDPLAPYRESLHGGSAANGRRIFFERGDAACSRCHRVDERGGSVGPDLSRIGGLRPRARILEDILFPNAEIARGYEQVVVTTRDDLTLVGRVESESDAELVLLDASNNRTRVPKADIASRRAGKSAMVEGLDKVLSKRDLRDLVAYLARLGNPEPPSDDIEPGGVVVDDEMGEGYVALQGDWKTGEGGNDYGKRCRWTTPDPQGRSTLAWTVPLPKPGRYRVYVWHGGDPSRDHATNAPYTVEHEGGTETIRVDQTQYEGMWRLLGTWGFSYDRPARVILGNHADRNVVGDAVKFVPE
jgi:quinoprotein glucose dehydrogenase